MSGYEKGRGHDLLRPMLEGARAGMTLATLDPDDCIICIGTDRTVHVRDQDVHLTIEECDLRHGRCDAPEEHHEYTPVKEEKE